MVQDEISQNTDLDDIEDLSITEEIVETRRLRPLASSLEFDVSRRPTQAKDRIAKRRVYSGVFLGLCLIVLGLAFNFGNRKYALFDTFDNLPLPATDNTFSASWLFVGLGLFLIITRLMLVFYGRDFFIGHKFAAVVIQKPFEHSHRLADSLNEYIGVRYRSRIVNVLGLTSFTQHIIDLQHPNEIKTIPLYITRNGDGISEKWETLARQMNMPAIFNTADGIIEIAPEDIQKSHPSLISEGTIPVSSKDLYKIPPSIKIVEDADTCQIDPQIRDSAFSAFSALLCFFIFFSVFFTTLLFAVQTHSAPRYMPVILVGLVVLALVPISLFFRRKRLIISKNGIRIKSRWIFFPSFGFLIPAEKLEYVHVIHNSYDFKYSLVLGADGQTAHVGRGLPKQDLDWLENFINAQIKRFICTKKEPV